MTVSSQFSVISLSITTIVVSLSACSMMIWVLPIRVFVLFADVDNCLHRLDIGVYLSTAVAFIFGIT